MRFDGEQPALREQTVYWNRDNANIAPVKDRTKQRNAGRKYESEREREKERLRLLLQWQKGIVSFL